MVQSAPVHHPEEQRYSFSGEAVPAHGGKEAHVDCLAQELPGMSSSNIGHRVLSLAFPPTLGEVRCSDIKVLAPDWGTNPAACRRVRGGIRQ